MIKNKWVDVNKKLPKENEYVLGVIDCTDYYGKPYEISIVYWEDNPKHRWFQKGKARRYRVTHWMELPKLPIL